MKRKTHTASGVYQYIESSGIDTGDLVAVANIKKEYWREVKRKWKQEKRKTETEFILYFTDAELHEITKAAKGYKASKTKYIKSAALAYSARQYYIPNQEAVNQIISLLALNYEFLLQQLENSPQVETSNLILEKMANLEHQIFTQLTKPQTIEELVTQILITQPEYKDVLLKLIQNCNV